MKFHIISAVKIIASFEFELHRDMAYDALTNRFPYADIQKAND